MPPHNPTLSFMTAELQTIFTIGVYGSTEESFFGALVENEIELFLDIRARRGMRGSKYKYANSNYLQRKLSELGIYYAHLKELAPTKEIRAKQQEADLRQKTMKRERIELSKEYVKAYRQDILKVYKRKKENRFYSNEMLNTARTRSQFPCNLPLHRIALFCVEQNPKACHRSLVANEWKRQHDIEIEHITA